jgi:hypothetical protein
MAEMPPIPAFSPLAAATPNGPFALLDGKLPAVPRREKTERWEELS